MSKRDDDRWQKRLKEVSAELDAERGGKPRRKRERRRPNTALIVNRLKEKEGFT